QPDGAHLAHLRRGAAEPDLGQSPPRRALRPRRPPNAVQRRQASPGPLRAGRHRGLLLADWRPPARPPHRPARPRPPSPPPPRGPSTGERLANAWGYNTVAFCAPESHYSYYGKLGEQVDEFKLMVRELHKHNIEVILDVVFNHPREGNHYGPTISFRGLDNA